MKLVATKHSHVELFVHINWTTKERAAVLDRLVRSDFGHLPDFSWQTGYAAFSVSPAEVDRVVSYVDNQESHHADNTLWPEAEPMPDKAG